MSDQAQYRWRDRPEAPAPTPEPPAPTAPTVAVTQQQHQLRPLAPRLDAGNQQPPPAPPAAQPAAPQNKTTSLGRGIQRTQLFDAQNNPSGISYAVNGQQGAVTSNHTPKGSGSFSVAPSSGVLNMMAGRAPEQAPEEAQRERQRSNPMDQFRREQMATYRTLNQKLIDGMNSTTAGRRLTADGFNAISGQMDNISSGLTGAEQNQLRSETELARQELVNQGRMSERQLMGEQDVQNAHLQGDLNSQQAREAAWLDVWRGDQTGENELRKEQARVLGTTGIIPIAPSITVDGNGNEVEDHTASTEANGLMAEFLAANGYDVNGAIDDIRTEMDRSRAKLEADATNTIEQEVFNQYQRIIGHLLRHAEKREGYSDGGLVMANNYRQSFADGGLVMPFDDAQPMPTGEAMPSQASPAAEPMMGGMAMQQYQQYIELARKSGIQPMGFEAFVKMQAESSGQPGAGSPAMPEMQRGAMGGQEIMGMAEGGMVPEVGGGLDQALGPQVDGKMVVDDNPNADVDSIPAMIDGEHPAALDSGEMVIPKDVVLFYGTQKLQQMIEKARQGATPQ